MRYPTYQEVQHATQYELGRWMRFLPSPENDSEVKMLDHIAKRFEGWTPALSKAVGWDK